MSSMTENSDPYLYPVTNALKNLRGLTDPKQLARFEARRTHRRIAELIDIPMPGRFDVAHLTAVHRYIFQDVYEWAGQFRTVNISKGGHLFGIAAFLEPALHKILEKLAMENYLALGIPHLQGIYSEHLELESDHLILNLLPEGRVETGREH
jgi:cell filamentation protein